MWQYDLNQNIWSQTISSSKTLPPPRAWHAMYVRQGGFVIFGGFTMKDALNDMWVFNVTTLSFTQTIFRGTQRVPTMCRFGNAYDASTDKLYVWGGEYGSGMGTYDSSRSMYVFDHRLLVWTKINYLFPETVLCWPCMWVHAGLVWRYGGHDIVKQLTTTDMLVTVRDAVG